MGDGIRLAGYDVLPDPPRRGEPLYLHEKLRGAELSKRVEAAFRKQFPKEQLMFHALNVGFTFEAIMIAADAFKRAGTADGTQLADAIRQTDIAEHMMIGGPIRFDEKGQNTQVASACIQNRDGQPVVVLPKEAAQKAPVYPVPGWRERA